MATALDIDVKMKPYGPKANAIITRPPAYDRKINILEGAVRSSKTWSLLPKFLPLSLYKVAGHKIIFGVSKQTIYNNVLSDLFEMVGPRHYTYNRQSGELSLFGEKWSVYGAKDEGSEKYVRGLTVGVAVGDEFTLVPESFGMMLLNRLSPDGARLYATTNPDNPYHYVKTKIIDNPDMRARGDLFVEHFSLDDNLNVSDDYKAYLRSSFSGVFKLRYIDGLWVVAEGAIYRDCWDEATMTYTGEPPVYVDRCVAVDCGTVHPQVYLDVRDDGRDVWIDREYYWDSVQTMKQKTDSEYGEDLEKFMEKAQDAMVILPPECASFEAELRKRGLWVTDADNEVMEGIKTVASLMSLRRIHFRLDPRCKKEGKCVCGQECCVRTAQEIPSYAWDPLKAKRGLEEPIKQKDDGCDAVRYFARTKISPWRLGAAA